jgi:drug/metabolite transporter (DMT)-like permease
LYFVEEIYENEYDGTVVTGLAQIIPWLTVPFIGLVVPDSKTITMAMLGGFFLVTSYFFYFKALFATGDATLIQIIWNTVGISVPVLAFLFLQERLSVVQYFGIAVTFLGAMYISFDNKLQGKNIKKTVLIMLGAILFLSLSMIFTRDVYSRTSFHGGIMFFSLGSILAGIFFYLLRIKKHGTGNLVNIGKKYYSWFLLAEGLTLMGVITSQRAIDISPAVSFVAVIESIQPAFIILSSAVIFSLLSLLSYKKKDVVKKIYADQLVGINSKIFAIVIMAIGIYMINL